MKQQNDPKQSCGLHCIKIHHFSVKFANEVILDDINMHIHCGKLHVLIGKNGAGKSTLIKAILNEVPHEGKIVFQTPQDRGIGGGRKLRGYTGQSRLKIGYVPQRLNVEKGTPVSVYDFMAAYISRFPVFLKRRLCLIKQIEQALSVFAAQDCIDKQLSNLSGGQLQRVLLSLALLNQPNLLLLDEPAAGIDKNGMDLFYETINMLKTNYDLAIILVSHDLEYVKRYADEVILLERRILKKGRPAQVFNSSEFQAVFGAQNRLTEQ